MLRACAKSLLIAFALFAASCASLAPSGTVELRVLALNDFHGNLEAPAGGVRMPDADGATASVPAGGAARLATLVAERRALSRHSILVAAGDLIGASPMLSSIFHDEPTIESMTMMGMALSAVGNHEFDDGPRELLRMQSGGCHPTDGCRGPAPFQGAGFQYLAASTIVDVTGETLFPASAVRTFGGVRVGFIGLALEGTPDLISPSASLGLSFRDEVETINEEAARLSAEGVQSIVVLIHEGGARGAGPGDCPSVSGPIVEIVEALHPTVDVIVSGHTNGVYICRVAGKLLTSAGNYGGLLTDIVLTLDRRTGDVIAAEAQNLVVAPTLTEDRAQVEHISAYRTLAAPFMNRRVGEITAPLSNTRAESGESPMGLVIADAMLDAGEGGRAQIALMNPGGVRSSLAQAGPVTLADAFAVQPFGNDLVVLTMTGAEIEAVLAQQFRPDRTFILQISARSGFAWRQRGNSGALVRGSVRIDGAPLNRRRSYRVVTNTFLAEGGDGFTAFRAGRDRAILGSDIDALEAYLQANTPLAPPRPGRIRLN